VIPIIMSSKAYQDHGAIILLNDETEGGDDAAHTSIVRVLSIAQEPFRRTMGMTTTADAGNT
jgi:hypothetical protein